MNPKDIVKDEIYRIENSLIQQKIFLDNNNQPMFITNVQIAKGTGLSETEVIDVITELAQNEKNEFIIFDNTLGISADENIQFFVRTRIYHIIWTLYRSASRTRSNPPKFNIGDYQYLRHVKRRPKQSENLEDVFNDEEIKKNFDYPKNDLFNKVIAHIKINTNFKKISNFQKKSTVKILKNLELRKKPRGIVLVAGTGAGKSFAYQFPLLLWILNKKFKKFDEFRKGYIKESDLHVNCTGLLIFPRNALAQDQFESISYLIDIINEEICKFPDAVGRKFLTIKKPLPDFHSNISGDLKNKYGNNSEKGYPDLIITHPKSLERRLINPDCSFVYKQGIDCVLYDEVHLWDGIEGAEIASLNARLQNLFQEKSNPPLFVGMSATIDQPEWHCQKLFSLLTEKKPESIIQGDDDDTVPFSIEHHLILKPRSGRPPIGVAIDTTSCLIHNRRNGLSLSHDDDNFPSHIDRENKDKSLTFIDSLNQTAKFANKLNNFEYFWDGHAQIARTSGSQRPYRSYLYHYRPEQRPPKGVPNNKWTANHDCNDCVNRTSPEIFTCPSYARGECWYYSSDDANQFANTPYGNWKQLVRGDRLTVPRDNIRSIRVSSLENKKIKNKYDYFLFKDNIWIPDGKVPASVDMVSDIDNIVSTSTLEVGVDFKKIKEIIQVGDIRSPSSYKQKAGRGAREGNSEDGLFVMTVINDSSLAYYHFKHFSRLVKSSLDPLKLETTNPNIIRSNCFFSIFDFMALNKINLFKIVRLEATEIDLEYEKAIKLLDDSKLEKYVARFLAKFNKSESSIIQKTIKDVRDFLEILSTKREVIINDVKIQHTLHEWLIQSVNSLNTLQEVKKQLGIDTLQKQEDAIGDITKYMDELETSYQKQFPDDDLITKKLHELRREIFE